MPSGDVFNIAPTLGEFRLRVFEFCLPGSNLGIHLTGPTGKVPLNPSGETNEEAFKEGWYWRHVPNDHGMILPGPNMSQVGCLEFAWAARKADGTLFRTLFGDCGSQGGDLSIALGKVRCRLFEFVAGLFISTKYLLDAGRRIRVAPRKEEADACEKVQQCKVAWR
jgi:hypothetical protein